MDMYADRLTGVKDRHSFLVSLEETSKTVKTLSLALLDINNFMVINDDLGHAAGDRVLSELGRYLGEKAESKGWTVGRLGGDEFAIIMPKLSLENAFLEVEELRREIAGADFFARLGDMGGIESFGVGIGVANIPRDTRDHQVLLRMADEALFSAKETDRNSVALPSNQEMVLKSCHYSSTQLRRLKALAEKIGDKESVLLREALDDLLKKYDVK
jgi:diguanylate cyclase